MMVAITAGVRDFRAAKLRNCILASLILSSYCILTNDFSSMAFGNKQPFCNRAINCKLVDARMPKYHIMSSQFRFRTGGS